MINFNSPSQLLYSKIIEKLHSAKIENYSNDKRNFTHLRNKKVLITGAGGSIGSSIAKKVAMLKPTAIGLLDINESGLADLLMELDEISSSKNTIFLIDISDKTTLKKVFRDFTPDYVYHAAAYKHVPVMEIFPEQALRVNIVGTYNVATLAGEFNSQKFILVSSDKAVYPSGVMGSSKKIAELIIRKIRFNYTTKYITVRFGNVIGSRGSVSEIFMRQISNGGPVTLTHPEMKRYFITMEQAVSLLLIASNIGDDGDLFILDMNKPIQIIDLINEFIYKLAHIHKQQIKIVITGIRPGEKLDERLMTDEESNYSKYENGFYRINTDYIIEENYLDDLKYFEKYPNDNYCSICKNLFESNSPVLLDSV